MSDPTSLSSQINKLNLGEPTTSSSNSNSTTEPSELVAVVDELLNQLTTKFSNVSAEIVSKMDEMSKRLDALESQIQFANSATATSRAAAEGSE